MELIEFRSGPSAVSRLSVFLFCLSMLLSSVAVSAQTFQPVSARLTVPSESSAGAVSPLFRVEKVRLDVGAELITILARRPLSDGPLQGPGIDLPLISVLKDTLGDDNPHNDLLRYVWMHSYTRPSAKQRAAAFVPFLYSGASNRKVGSDPPPAVIDGQPSDRVIWNKIFWYLFKRMVVNDLSVAPRASAMQYRQNSVDHHRSAVADSLAALSLFHEIEGERLLSDSELVDIQARLALTDKTFGWKMQSENLQRVYDHDLKIVRDYRGHNWELLRQYTEEQGLYFDPLITDDGAARHAIVWTAESDLKANQGKAFESRFLNMKNPWKDKRLVNWQGYTQVRWFDAEDRQVEPGTAGATAKTMIPLALYGLDNPKIPTILVDFRDAGSPKFRELSRRILADVTDNVLALSRFHSLPYFFGRMIYEFVTGRRGIDLNQASRFRSYSQLRLLLAIDQSLDPRLKGEIAKRMNSSSTNPLGNDIAAESRIAVKQYENLMAHAADPGGLAKKIRDDRREEMVQVKHSGGQRAFFAAANVLTLGRYTHREKETPELVALMDLRRQLNHHERTLREIAYKSAGPEIDTDLAKLTESLNFMAQNGANAEVKTARALAKIYAISRDGDLKMLCLSSLFRINNASAKKELLAIYHSAQPADQSRGLSARYLKLALEEGQRISERDASSINAIAEPAAN